MLTPSVCDRPVRLVSDLCVIALRQKKDKGIALWHCLRSKNVTGCGELDLAVAMEGLVRDFSYSRRTAYRHLKLGRDASGSDSTAPGASESGLRV